MKAVRHARGCYALALLAVGVAGCGLELEHNLDERQANGIVAVLEQAGVSADKAPEEGQADAYKIVVPRSEAGRAFALLEARDLPRRGQRGLSETFAKDSLLPSPVEDRARFAAALGAELERTLERVPGVAAARVHLALPAEEPLVGASAHGRPTASVLLRAGAAPLGIGELDVKRLVAGAVPGLQAADVGVVVAGAAVEPAPPPFERVGPLKVARESRTLTATLATSALGIIVLLALGLAYTALRLGQLRRRARSGGGGGADSSLRATLPTR
jgi:type III secretion protein J